MYNHLYELPNRFKSAIAMLEYRVHGEAHKLVLVCTQTRIAADTKK